MCISINHANNKIQRTNDTERTETYTVILKQLISICNVHRNTETHAK